MRYSKSGRQEQECQVGAFFAAFIRGGAFCVELGATLLVLLGGGAFCVVPGATLLVLLGGGAAGVARTGRFVKRHGKKEVRARNTQSKIKKRAERRGA